MTTFEKYGLKIFGLIFFLIPGIIFAKEMIFLLNRDGIKTYQDFFSFIFMLLFSAFVIFMGLSWIFPGLFSSLFKPKMEKCIVCSKYSADILVIDGNKKYERYCRNHLLEKFSQAFLVFPHKMVVFYPEQEREYCGSIYPYFPIDEMVSVYKFQKEDTMKIQEIIDTITGKCAQCDKNIARVAFFRKGLLSWDGSGPVLRNISKSPIFLCTKCTLEYIEHPLRANKTPFYDNGLFIPYKGEGVFVNTYL